MGSERVGKKLWAIPSGSLRQGQVFALL